MALFDREQQKIILLLLIGERARDAGVFCRKQECAGASFDAALRRFKRSIEKTGLLTELRAREFYEKPTAERKRKLAAAVKRHYKRLRSQTLPPKLY